MTERAIPKQAAVWDERRNSSQTLAASPTAQRELTENLRRLREQDPALVRWIEDGYPNLTDEEHYARFGHYYGRKRR